MRKVARIGALALVFVLGLAPPAAAHAQFLSSDPADGASLDDPPEVVSLEFDEPVRVTLGGIRVFDDAGDRVDGGDTRTGERPEVVEVPMDGELPTGTYIVTWRVVSADGHSINGGFVFSVGEPVDVDQGLVSDLFSEGDDRPYEIGGAALRGLGYGGALLASGGAAFVVVVADARRRAVVRGLLVAAGVAVVATLGGLVTQAALATGLGLGSIAEPGVLGGVLEEGSGLSLAGLVTGLGLVAGALVGPARWSRATVAAGFALVVAGFAVAGHTRTTDPAGLVYAADAAHLAAVAVWFGGLVLLGFEIRHRRGNDDPAGAAAAVARFSTLAGVAILAVIGAGLALSWAEVRVVDALTSTTYGRLLMAKTILVAGIAGIGAYNRWWLVPVVTRRTGATAQWQRLDRTVRVEALGIVAVLALTGVLTNVTPAAEAAGISAPYSTTVDLADGSVNVTVEPTEAGATTMHLYILDELGRQVDGVDDLRLQLSLPADGIGPIGREPFKAGPGHFQLDGNHFAVPGDWEVAVIARLDRFTEDRARFDVTIRS